MVKDRVSEQKDKFKEIIRRNIKRLRNGKI